MLIHNHWVSIFTSLASPSLSKTNNCMACPIYSNHPTRLNADFRYCQWTVLLIVSSRLEWLIDLTRMKRVYDFVEVFWWSQSDFRQATGRGGGGAPSARMEIVGGDHLRLRGQHAGASSSHRSLLGASTGSTQPGRRTPPSNSHRFLLTLRQDSTKSCSSCKFQHIKWHKCVVEIQMTRSV